MCCHCSWKLASHDRVAVCRWSNYRFLTAPTVSPPIPPSRPRMGAPRSSAVFLQQTLVKAGDTVPAVKTVVSHKVHQANSSSTQAATRMGSCGFSRIVTGTFKLPCISLINHSIWNLLPLDLNLSVLFWVQNYYLSLGNVSNLDGHSYRHNKLHCGFVAGWFGHIFYFMWLWESIGPQNLYLHTEH